MRNLLIVTKAIAVALWFNALNRVFELWMPKRGWISSFIMLFIATLLLLVDDGDLSELHNMEPPIAAIVGSQSHDETNKNN